MFCLYHRTLPDEYIEKIVFSYCTELKKGNYLLKVHVTEKNIYDNKTFVISKKINGEEETIIGTIDIDAYLETRENEKKDNTDLANIVNFGDRYALTPDGKYLIITAPGDESNELSFIFIYKLSKKLDKITLVGVVQGLNQQDRLYASDFLIRNNQEIVIYYHYKTLSYTVKTSSSFPTEMNP